MDNNILLYQCIHKSLFKKYGNTIVDIKIIENEHLGRNYHIEKPLRSLIIKEMIIFGLLKKVNNRNIEIVPLKFDPIEHYDKVALKLGVYE